MADPVKCPKCGSEQVSGGAQGFNLGKAAAGDLLLGPIGLLAGAIGSKDVVVSCLACGNHWKPGAKGTEFVDKSPSVPIWVFIVLMLAVVAGAWWMISDTDKAVNAIGR